MNTYKVKQEDITGQLKGFPIEVVQAMVDEQVRQGYKADVSVFQKCRTAGAGSNGISWNLTENGYSFWCDIIENLKFDRLATKQQKTFQTKIL
ncbi:MAG: hypothetical protein ACRCX5_14340 [Bacteroidales bacterium]